MADPTLVTNPDLVAGVTKIYEFLSHGMTALMTAQGIQLVKKAPRVTFFSEDTDGKIKAAISAALALATSLGVTVAFQRVPVPQPDGSIHYMIDIGVLTTTSLWSHLWSVAQQWSLQQGAYSGLIKAKEVVGPPAQLKAAAPVSVVVEGIHGTGTGS
jgi:hypothetical protein